MPKIPAGAVYKPVQQIPDGATYDTPEASKQTLDPSQPGMQPAQNYSLWDRVKSLVPQSNSYVGAVKNNIQNEKDFLSSAAGDVKDAVTNPRTYLGPVVNGGIDSVKQLYGMASRGSIMPPEGEGGVSLKGTGANLGINTQGVEDEANKGSLGGVLGHSALPLGLVFGGGAVTKGGVGTSIEEMKAAGRNMVVPGTSADLLTRATKPTVGLPEYEESLQRQIPALFDESVAAGKPIKGVADLAATADSLKNAAYGKYQNMLSVFRKPQGEGPYNPAQVDARPVADAQMNSIPAVDLFEQPNKQVTKYRDVPSRTVTSMIEGEPVKQRFGGGQEPIGTSGDPGIVNRTKAIADLYRTDMPVDQADAIVRDSNAKLREIYNKIGGKRTTALSNPETARLFAMDNSLRDQLYGTIKEGTGENPKPIMEQYGDLTDIGDTAARRNTVFSRQQPFPLGQQINDGAALASGKPAQAVLSRIFKTANDSDWLTKEAFRREGRGRNAPQVSYGAIATAMNSKKR